MPGVARKHNKSSQGQEDVLPDEPLKEAIMGLWYDDSVPKPNIKVIFIQTTLILFTGHSWHPCGILQPLPDPIVDVVRCVDIHGEAEGLHISDSATVAVKHPTLFGGVLGHQGVCGDGCCLHKPRVHDLTLVVPLQGTECVNHHYLAQRAR